MSKDVQRGEKPATKWQEVLALLSKLGSPFLDWLGGVITNWGHDGYDRTQIDAPAAEDTPAFQGPSSPPRTR